MNTTRREALLGLSTGGIVWIAGCSGDESQDGDIQDSDGDGVIDSEDYAPNDPEVQEKSDVTGTPTASPTSTPTPTPTEEPTATATAVSDSDGDGVRDSLDDFPDDPDYDTLYDDTDGEKFLTPGEYWYERVEITGNNTTLAWELDTSGESAIDVIVMDESEFSKWEDGDQYEYYTGLSDFETNGTEEAGRLDEGDYRTVYSNWDVGADESVNISFEMLIVS